MILSKRSPNMADEPSDLEGLLESYAEIEAKGESVIVARRQVRV